MYEQTVGTQTWDEIDEVIVIEEAGVDAPDEELDDGLQSFRHALLHSVSYLSDSAGTGKTSGSLVECLCEENAELREALRAYTLVVE